MATKARESTSRKQSKAEGRGTNEACLPFPATLWFCIAATRQGYPGGELALGLDGPRPRCEETSLGRGNGRLCYRGCSTTRLPLVGDEDYFSRRSIMDSCLRLPRSRSQCSWSSPLPNFWRRSSSASDNRASSEKFSRAYSSVRRCLAGWRPAELLSTLSDLGVMFLLFRVGLEVKASELMKVGGTALLVAVAESSCPSSRDGESALSGANRGWRVSSPARPWSPPASELRPRCWPRAGCSTCAPAASSWRRRWSTTCSA